MRLAKPRLDIGLFTADIGRQREFWGGQAGLRLDHELTLQRGWVQHRFDAHGSVVKVNHLAAGVPARPPSGITGLTVAVDGRTEPWIGEHPGGDRVELVAPGTGGVTGIGITLTSPDPDRLLGFYRDGLEFEPAGPYAVLCGDSLVSVTEGPGGPDSDDAVLVGPGFRYLTVQVFDADVEMAGIVGRGGRIVRDPVSFAGVARFGFVADPDGNWIEISARTSLTGIEVTT
jgi:lactoylglutathione lyase